MSVKDEIAHRLTEAGGRLTVKSALNPMLWMCGLVSGPALIAATRMDVVPAWLQILILSPVLSTILGFFALLIWDRDKLQSEDFQLKKRTLEIYEQKGMSAPISFAPNAAITTPPRPDGTTVDEVID
jgi:predicted signal transduction protein with EAL and GGDEF domain